ncbi:MAG: DUF2784 domain-containing protein [Chryseosolibacter sp.]
MENITFYKFANSFFFVFHVALIFFNLFGWAPRSLRKWNLITLLLTAISWFGLGICYGFGYCFLTDWHWQIRNKLGYATDSNSYIHFLITELMPLSIGEAVVDVWTAILFFLALAVSIALNMRDRQRHTSGKRKVPGKALK